MKKLIFLLLLIGCTKVERPEVFVNVPQSVTIKPYDTVPSMINWSISTTDSDTAAFNIYIRYVAAPIDGYGFHNQRGVLSKQKDSIVFCRRKTFAGFGIYEHPLGWYGFQIVLIAYNDRSVLYDEYTDTNKRLLANNRLVVFSERRLEKILKFFDTHGRYKLQISSRDTLVSEITPY